MRGLVRQTLRDCLLLRRAEVEFFLLRRFALQHCDPAKRASSSIVVEHRARPRRCPPGRIAPRDRVLMFEIRKPSLRAKRSNPSRRVKEEWIASLALAMTVSTHATLSTVIARLDRAIQYSRDIADEWRSRGVLDTRRSLSSGSPKARPGGGL